MNPRSVRFTAGEDAALDAYAASLDLKPAHIVRLCVRYTLPKLRRGTITQEHIVKDERAL